MPDAEMAVEAVLVGDHQASGLAENTVKNAQGQLRVIKDALESRRGGRAEGERQIEPWMVILAESAINRGRKDVEGFLFISTYRRWKV